MLTTRDDTPSRSRTQVGAVSMSTMLEDFSVATFKDRRVSWPAPSGPVSWPAPSGPVSWSAPSGPVSWSAPSGPVSWSAPSGPVSWSVPSGLVSWVSSSGCFPRWLRLVCFGLGLGRLLVHRATVSAREQPDKRDDEVHREEWLKVVMGLTAAGVRQGTAGKRAVQRHTLVSVEGCRWCRTAREILARRRGILIAWL